MCARIGSYAMLNAATLIFIPGIEERTFAQAEMVAPVVMTSSTSSTWRPSSSLALRTEKAPCTL